MYKPTTPCIATRRQLVDLLLSAQESSAFLWRHASCLARNNATPLQNITTHTSISIQHGGIYSGGSHLKSFVWKSFGFYKRGGQLDKTNAICRICRTAIPYKSASSGPALTVRLTRRATLSLKRCGGPPPALLQFWSFRALPFWSQHINTKTLTTHRNKAF